jgi:tetratricopeptide (TPR) repeat protein
MKNFYYRLPFVFLFQLIISTSFAQEDFSTRFEMGKDLYKKGKYTPAMEIFKPLTSEQEGNNYVEYAEYFYGLSAFKAGLFSDANSMLLQLIYKYPNWEKIDEAYYLLANVAFEQKKYRQAFKYLEGRKKDLKDDSEQMKNYYLGKFAPIDSLINIQKDFPTDPTIASILFKRLSALTTPNEKQKMLIEYLAQEFKFEKKKLAPEKVSVKKPSYNVAILFPFLLKELNLNNANRSNQYVFDMYQGIRMAADSLKRAGVNLNLYAYDTEKSDVKVNEILNYPELKNMDLIVGPVFPNHYSIVNEFGLRNSILVVNPISGNSNLIETNPFVYLYHPSLYNLTREAATFADSSFVKDDVVKNVLIFQSPTLKDSLLAKSYRDSITARGFNVKFHEVINKENIKRVQELLKDSLMLTTVSHLFVSTSDQVLAANIVSAMEISATKIPIFAGADWLQFPLLTYDQYERRGVHFLFPDFIDYNKHQIYDFRKEYFHRMNSVPLTSHAYQGYDLMRLWGRALGKYGNFPIAGIQKDGFIPGYVLSGFDYSHTQSNDFVPLVKFQESSMRIVNYPSKSSK